MFSKQHFSLILHIGAVFIFPTSNGENSENTTLLQDGVFVVYADFANLKDGRFLDAMEKALEICPNYRLCGHLSDIYLFEDAQLYDRYTGILEKQLNKPLPGDHMCCKPCSCDSNCNTNNVPNCCPDAGILWYNSTFTDNSGFRPLTMCRSSVLRERINSSQRQRPTYYSAVNQCSTFTTLLCNFPGNTFAENVFVYSPETQLIYQNKQCAECNGVYEMKAWDLVASGCPTNLYDLEMDDIELQEYVLSKCIIKSDPFLGLDIEPFVCFTQNDVYVDGKCNQTGKWDVFDPTIKRLCAQRFSYNVRDYFLAYTNIFCYMCNQPSGLTPTEIQCSKTRDDYWSQLDEGPVYDLLTREPRVTTTWTLANGQNNTACPSGSFLDPVSGECWLFNCPHDSRPLLGGCYSRLFNAREKVLEFSLFLQFLNRPSETVIFDYYVKDTLPSNVLRQISLSTKCEVFDVEIIIIAQTDVPVSQYIGYVARFRVLDTEPCTLQLSRLRLNSQRFEYWVGTEIVKTSITWIPKAADRQDMSNYILIYSKEFNKDLAKKVVLDAPIFYCPYLEMNVTLLCRAFKKQTPCPTVTDHPQFAKFVEVQFLEYNNFYICIDGYIHIIREIYGDNSEFPEMSASMFPGNHSILSPSIILFYFVWLLTGEYVL